jgi:hypothetical protein
MRLSAAVRASARLRDPDERPIMAPDRRPVPHAAIHAYPWALADEGPDRAFATMRRCGVGAAHLALSYHVGAYLTPRGGARRVHAGDLGGLHFDAPAVLVDGWPFPPLVSSLVTGPSYFAGLADAAERHGLRLVAWIVYLYQHALARERPQLAVRNAFGDQHGAQLCPANPEVRAYAHALTRATLALGRFDGMYIEALKYLPYEYGLLNAKAAVAPGQRARSLLSLCFCAHCRRAAVVAGIDVDGLASAVRTWLDDHLNRLPDGIDGDTGVSIGEELGDALAALVRCRSLQVVELQREVIDLAHEAGLRVASDVVEPDELRVNGDAPFAVRGQVDEVRVKLLPGMDVGSVVGAIDEARHRARADVVVVAFYPIGSFASEGSFVRAVESARAAGIRHHRFYEYSLLSRRQVEWLEGARELWSDSRRA